MRSWFSQNRNGIIIGFFFGTIGLWILAGFGLGVPGIALIATPLLLPGKLIGSLLFGVGSIMGMPHIIMVITLTLFNGVFYAFIGGFLQQFFHNSSHNL